MSDRSVIDVLEERGFLSQITDTGLREAAQTSRLKCYVGFDPTAPSLHLGNLMQVMTLAHFQRAGHIPMPVVGAGTGMIGDPSGKAGERSLLPVDVIDANGARFKIELSHFLDFEGENAAIMVNNADWLRSLKLIDFLRDIGKHFSVNAMVQKESVRARLEDREQGISFTEFSYMLLQAYDFLQLYNEYGCNVQAGGNDQWGNITLGIDLIRRMSGGQAHGITSPLLTTSSGQKFGKSEAGAIYLNPELTSPYQMYQFWINCEDADVIKLLKLYTFLPLSEIADLEAQMTAKPEGRIPQRVLAYDVTARVHGDDAAKAVRRAGEILFGTELTEIDAETLRYLSGEVPTTTIPQSRLADGIALIDIMAESGLAASKGAARKLIEQGGVNVNNRRVSDVKVTLGSADTVSGRAILLRAGKKNYHLLKVE